MNSSSLNEDEFILMLGGKDELVGGTTRGDLGVEDEDEEEEDEESGSRRGKEIEQAKREGLVELSLSRPL